MQAIVIIQRAVIEILVRKPLKDNDHEHAGFAESEEDNTYDVKRKITAVWLKHLCETRRVHHTPLAEQVLAIPPAPELGRGDGHRDGIPHAPSAPGPLAGYLSAVRRLVPDLHHGRTPASEYYKHSGCTPPSIGPDVLPADAAITGTFVAATVDVLIREEEFLNACSDFLRRISLTLDIFAKALVKENTYLSSQFARFLRMEKRLIAPIPEPHILGFLRTSQTNTDSADAGVLQYLETCDAMRVDGVRLPAAGSHPAARTSRLTLPLLGDMRDRYYTKSLAKTLNAVPVTLKALRGRVENLMLLSRTRGTFVADVIDTYRRP